MVSILWRLFEMSCFTALLWRFTLNFVALFEFPSGVYSLDTHANIISYSMPVGKTTSNSSKQC